MSETHSVVPAPSQFAAITAYDNFEMIQKEHIFPSIYILKILAAKMHEIFYSFTVAEKSIQVHYPDGAFYFFLSFEDFKKELSKKGIRSGEEMCQSLLNEAGVAMLPGSSFGRSADELTARLSYVDFNGEEALKLFQDPSQFSEEKVLEVCSRCLTGAERIVEWLMKKVR